MIYNVGVGGSTASQPTPEKIPNDPAGAPNSGASPFQAPQGWSAWGQPQPDPAQSANAFGNAPGMPQAASPGGGTSNHTSPLAQTILGQSSGLPVDPSKFGPNTQAAIKSNAQFAQQYQANEQASRSQLMDALGGLATMASWTNPYSGMSQTANLTGG